MAKGANGEDTYYSSNMEVALSKIHTELKLEIPSPYPAEATTAVMSGSFQWSYSFSQIVAVCHCYHMFSPQFLGHPVLRSLQSVSPLERTQCYTEPVYLNTQAPLVNISFPSPLLPLILPLVELLQPNTEHHKQ